VTAMSKETIKALRGLMIFAAVLVLAVLHLDKVIMFIGLVIGILRPFLIGAAVAFAVSLVAIKFLMNFVKKHDFKVFGWYRIALGALVIAAMVIPSLLSV
ncbi:MAG: undecaprenyl-diphosphate phosphatase, partial [Clostridia bacterium]|nr:undecaprenyl-diphosphate phosphatase [Clostridia bacterium]